VYGGAKVGVCLGCSRFLFFIFFFKKKKKKKKIKYRDMTPTP